MLKRISTLIASLILLAALVSAPAAAGTNSYILRTPTAAQAQAICQRYGLQMVRNLGSPDVFLVRGSDSVPPDVMTQWMKGDPDVKHFEPDLQAQVPEANFTAPPYSPSAPLSTAVSDKSLASLFGSQAWIGYVQQPALYLINADDEFQRQVTGDGVTVAVIDTGVDPRHPILSGVLVPGYDFTRGLAGAASELSDLNQSTAAILEQSTAAILEQSTAAILEGSSVVLLNQSTAAILEQSTAAVLEGQQIPSHFGHGTMVAGLVHLIAPEAKIMPLKAFRADGSARLSDIVHAIYYATNHGAKVINMSFSLPSFSTELMRAVNYASRNHVICIASAGNEGKRIFMYPAALGNVVGVASTNMDDQRSSFTNYGPDLVTVAAPGEGLVTIYPGAHYAAVSGTSFSSALVAGGAALLVDASLYKTNLTLEDADVRRAFSDGALRDGDLGFGRIDLINAVDYIKNVRLPKPKKNKK